MTLHDLPLNRLRAMLHDTERLVGTGAPSVAIIRREVELRERQERAAKRWNDKERCRGEK